MLTAKGLRKRYKQREVVADFGLTLQPGEVVGLLGPNGAGKTTCFYMIVGLVAADAGSIELKAEDRDFVSWLEGKAPQLIAELHERWKRKED